MDAFLHMGGYAAYVWPAYAVFFLVLLIDFLAPNLRRRRLLRELHARMQRQKARDARKAARRTPSDPHDPTSTPLDS
ncbi:heme exporter protein CcmD [Oleiagrimonas soli]|uniref:Heme exporter protein D n=1 Tax=Oleiagrimonas soli TaxID=1543381 RepID=A0A841KG47_9GAMM|nr:heme exporter protein CcmD [Oleiagrimonas soli]MBB6182977.1 heme exporter protein D [Oleiagrimonas soli]